jgi:hypothetical protein
MANSLFTQRARDASDFFTMSAEPPKWLAFPERAVLSLQVRSVLGSTQRSGSRCGCRRSCRWGFIVGSNSRGSRSAARIVGTGMCQRAPCRHSRRPLTLFIVGVLTPAARVPDAEAAVGAGKVVRQHQRHHRFHGGDGARQHARVVAPFARKATFFAPVVIVLARG